MRPERSEAARREPSGRNEEQVTTSLKEEIAECFSRVCELKRVREAEWVAAKR